MSDYFRLTEEYQTDCNKCENRQCTIKDSYCKDRINCEMYNRLAELEDKITQGLMVELPCMVGDIVYRVVKGLPIREWEVTSICFNRADMTDYVITATTHNPISHWKFWSKDFGEILFLTKAEAEQKLKELKGEV